MKDLLEMRKEARSYLLCRDAGVGHDAALDKACRGNWNPYTTSQPVVTDERRAEVRAICVAEGVLAS